MSVNLNASWEPIDWHCASSVQGYVIVLRDLTIGQNVGNVTINGAEITTATLIDLHYLHDFSIVVMAFNEVGLGPASPANSSLASSSTYESGIIKVIIKGKQGKRWESMVNDRERVLIPERQYRREEKLSVCGRASCERRDQYLERKSPRQHFNKSVYFFMFSVRSYVTGVCFVCFFAMLFFCLTHS